MAALELLTGYVTAPSTTLTALTMASGNSLTIRNAAEGSDIFLLNAWVDVQTADQGRIRSPLLHDNVQGLRFFPVASLVRPLFPLSFMQRLEAQDTLVAELSGSGTSGDIETMCMLIYYSDLPGVDADLRSPDDVLGAAQNFVTVENTLSLGTSGGYSGEEAINTEFDLLKANTDYAILGYLVSAECAAIRYRSASFGNLGIGGPGDDSGATKTESFFIDLSRETGLPLVPVFNSADRANVLLDGAQDENGTDVTVTTILAQLS